MVSVMIKNNSKVIVSYLIGIALSIFLSLAFGIVWDFSPYLFSSITGILTISLMYSDVWHFGKYDKLRERVHIKNALISMMGFVIISLTIELLALIFKLADMQTALLVISLIAMVWFYPFTGFYAGSVVSVKIIIIIIIVVVICTIAYYMGTKNIALIEKYGFWKKKMNEKKDK